MSAHDQASAALDRFTQQIRKLKVHRSAAGPSQKKPLLMLLVLSRLKRGLVKDNRLRFGDIEDEFTKLLREFGGGSGGSLRPEEPFVRMRTEPFWTLHVPEDADPAKLPSTLIRSERCYASLDPEVHAALKESPESADAAAEVVLETWVPPERHDEFRKRLHLR